MQFYLDCDLDGLEAAAERIDVLFVSHHANRTISDSPLETGIEAVSSWATYFHSAEAIRAEWNRGRRLCLIGGSDGPWVWTTPIWWHT